MSLNRSDPRVLMKDQDFLSGVMFVVVGAAARYLSYDYPLGSLTSPGSGAFPMLLCYGLMLIGATLIVRSFFILGTQTSGWDLWALVFVIAAIVAFQFLIDQAGLVASMIALILLAAIAGRETKPLELAVFTLILVTMSVSLFIFGLGLPIKAFPWG